MSINVKEYVASLSDEDLVSEVLCWNIPAGLSEDEIVEMIKKRRIKSVAVNATNPQTIDFIRKKVKEIYDSPCLVCADVEFGPIFSPETKKCRTSMMGLGATDDGDLAFEIGKYTGRITRATGIHVTISPVVDINYNSDNPIVNTRSAGDTPEKVIKIAGGYGRGCQCEGRVAVNIKHFPGDGVDDRNQHFCTSVNSLSRDEWMASYGKVYKELFANGVQTIMVGHIALPWCDPTYDECGYLPGTLSKPIMTDLLRGELGFDGCIISDAMSMIGTAVRVPLDRLSVEFLRAGGDIVLFPEKEDHTRILNALHSGELDRARLIDAVERVVKLKCELGLYDDKEYELSRDDVEKITSLYSEAAKKSITLVRNYDNVLPMKLSKAAKVLVISLTTKERDYDGDDYPEFANELEAKGFDVIRLTNPSHYKVKELIDKVECVFIASHIDMTRCSGSSLRLGWNNLMTFWRGYVLQNPNVVFVSFGDPYKTVELPFLKTVVNAYYNSSEVAKATIEACLGNAEFPGTSPVNIPNR